LSDRFELSARFLVCTSTHYYIYTSQRTKWHKHIHISTACTISFISSLVMCRRRRSQRRCKAYFLAGGDDDGGCSFGRQQTTWIMIAAVNAHSLYTLCTRYICIWSRVTRKSRPVQVVGGRWWWWWCWGGGSVYRKHVPRLYMSIYIYIILRRGTEVKELALTSGVCSHVYVFEHKLLLSKALTRPTVINHPLRSNRVFFVHNIIYTSRPIYDAHTSRTVWRGREPAGRPRHH